MSSYELAQLNIGIIKGPMDSPVMAEFAANLVERTFGLVDAIFCEPPGPERQLTFKQKRNVALHAQP